MIKRELPVFLVVGVLTVLVDFLLYHALLNLFAVDAAKACGFIGGTVFAYLANRKLTFGHHTHRRGSVWRFAAVYASTLSINVWVNAMVLSELAHTASVTLAFVAATAVSATLNFLGMKFFVFTRAAESTA